MVADKTAKNLRGQLNGRTLYIMQLAHPNDNWASCHYYYSY